MGNKLYSYTYDAWGRFARTQVLSVSTTAIVNPYLYRGYYYDYDLGLYYLQSRYYDSNTCRFINADSYVSTGQGILGYNMFAYCGNNPVMYRDDTGNSPSHVMVCLMDGGSSAIRYSTSIGDVLIFSGEGKDENTKHDYAKAFPNYIIVFDQRYCKDGCTKCNPNMQIWNSYMIDESAKQREILEILYAYDKAHPSRHAWGRTVDSMLVEWDAHNDIYRLAKYISYDYANRVAHTDFDYNDEGKTYEEYWQRAIKEALGL